MTNAARSKAASKKKSSKKSATQADEHEIEHVELTAPTTLAIDVTATEEEMTFKEAKAENAVAGDEGLDAGEYVFVDDPNMNRLYVGPRPTDGRHYRIGPLPDNPEGHTVVTKSGKTFVVPLGVTDWAAVVDPHTGKNLLTGKK